MSARYRSRPKGSSSRFQRRRLFAETLEDRRLLAVSFEFNYLADNTIGFNDPVEGSGYRAALESAATRLGDWLLQDATIQMDVVSRAFDGTAVAKATSEPALLIPGGGFAHAVVPDKIINGIDPNGVSTDGRLEVFFFSPSDVFTYVTDPIDVDVDDEIDFQAVMIHELVHTLGFTSATRADGSDDSGNGITTPGTWSVFDQFVSDVSGDRMIDADPMSLTAFRMDTAAWATHSVGGKGPDAGLFFDGPIAKSVYGGRVPLYSPSTFSLESSVSHLDSEGFPNQSFQFSPSTHLMSHAIVDGQVPQELTLLEKAMLADIGILLTENVRPQVTPPANLVVEANGRGGFLGTNQAIADFLASATAVDQIDPNPIITNNKPSLLSLGQNVITFTATDASGNTGTATAVISVFDTTPPSIEVSPTSVTLEATSPSGVTNVTLPFVPTVSDIVDPNPLVTFDGGTDFSIGTTTAKFTARDFRNNVAMASVEIVVQDSTPPQFALPESITITANRSDGADLTNETLLALIQSSSSDVADSSLDVSAVPPSFPIGTTSVTFTVTDDSGNAANVTTALTVEDVGLVVRTLDDELDPDPTLDPDDLSLREAISLANANAGIDNIRFDAGLVGSVLLDAALGQLMITDSVNLIGLGNEMTVVDGQALTRVFAISGDQVDVVFQDLTIRGGRSIGELSGGAGIHFDSSSGSLLLDHVKLADNQTTGVGAAGAGIQVSAGDLTLVDSQVTGNRTTGEFASGGGLWFGGSSLSVVRSEFADNSTTGNYASAGALYSLNGATTISESTLTGNSTTGIRAGGGAIAIIAATATIRSSTIAGNSTAGAMSSGGGIRTLLAPTRLINSTVSGNTTGSFSSGGGVFADRGSLTVEHTTITGNIAAGVGGGIALPVASTLPLTIRNSIVAANDDIGTAPDLLGTGGLTVSQAVRYSLIGDNTGTAIVESQAQDPVTGNLVGNSSGGGIINPILGPLSDNGGLTPTHALLQGSPAFNAGDPDFDPASFSPPLINDQRGDGFARVDGDRIDMGSFEAISEVVVTWENPDDITFGTLLSAIQLNATANVPGSFSYIPPAGVLLNAGPSQMLTVTFTPTSTDFDPVTKTVKINVNKADPVILWNQPAAIVEGTPLSEVQLNATSDVGGTFVYDPAAGTVLGVGEDQVLTATFTPSNPDNFNTVQSTVLIDVIVPQDFGDAPSQYPVLLSQDGARHLLSTLFLGSQVDADLNGQPSAQADGDGADEDGVTFVADPVAVAGDQTIASWLVEASEAGKLDAWIDFNGDGDWNDPGEQVHQATDLVTGFNLLNYTVPVGSMPGTTVARLRLSSAGGLSPTGAAADGEVEDHLVTILDGANAPDASIRLVDPSSEILVESGELVVRQGSVVSFRAPIANLGSLAITGSAADESLIINLLGGLQLPVNGLQLDGGSGGNRLIVIGDNETLDLTDASLQVDGFRHLDLSNEDANGIVLDVGSVARLSPMLKVVEIVAGAEDQLSVSDADNWRMSDPIIVNGTFILTARHVGVGGETIQAELPRAWQNFLRPGDVNNDGKVLGVRCPPYHQRAGPPGVFRSRFSGPR